MTTFSTVLLSLAILLPMAYVLFLVATSHVVRAVFARNLMSYFSGVLGYLFIVVFVVSAAILAFNAQFFTANLANLDQLTKSYPLLLLFIVPAITMSVWAEERKQGTDELLFTLPANDMEILLGKYLAVVAVYSVALAFSTGLWAVLELYADPGWRMFLSTYFGYWLAGSSLLAVGMFASALTRSATVAFVLGGIFCAIPVFLSTSALGLSSELLKETLGGYVSLSLIEPLTAFSVGEHLHEFSLGVVRLSSVLYFESLAVLFLYLNLIVISERHWSRDQKWQMGLQYALRAASVLGILISVYIVGTQSSGRADIDLTPTKYFTLSDATLEVLDNIEPDRPITIQAFLSPDVPTEFVRTKRRLEGLLRQIDQRGGSLVDVRIQTTSKYQPAAEEAKTFGIEPRRVDVEVDGKLVREDVFLGLVVSSSYDEVVVPFLGRGTPLEFELTRSLRTVANAHRLTVGILETQARVMSNRKTQEIIKELEKHYHVESVSADQPIERERQLFAIETQSVLTDLENAKDGEVPKSLREVFEKKKTPLSTDLELTFDKETDSWQLRDFRVHRKYKIHAVETKQDEDDNSPKPDGEKAEEKEDAPKYAVSIDRYDALIAVLPSTLSTSQMGHFVEYIQAGGPTLIFDDPLPVGLQYHPISTLAPRINVNPPPPLEQDLGARRADFGEATTLLNALGLQWDNGEVAWDLYNPFPEFEESWQPGVFTVVGRRSGEEDAVNQDNPVTEGLGRLLLLYGGQIRQKPGSKMEFTPLLQTGKTLSGVFSWDDIALTRQRQVGSDPATRRPIDVEFFQVLSLDEALPPAALETLSEEQRKNLIDGTRFRRDGNSHVLAAQIKGQGESKVSAIFVADADLIGDQFFELRNEQSGNLDLDNVSFVLNAIDVLAGETSFLELRRRKSPQASLEEIEKLKEGLRAKKLKAENEAKIELAKQREKLDQVVKDLEKELQNSESSSRSEVFQKLQDASMTLLAEKDRVDREKKKLKEELARQKDAAKTEYERGVKATENWIRLKAIVLPSLPAIAMGLIFLSFRLINEHKEITPDRRR